MVQRLLWVARIARAALGLQYHQNRTGDYQRNAKRAITGKHFTQKDHREQYDKSHAQFIDVD